MRRSVPLIFILSLLTSAICAQVADPVVMKVGENEIRKSEFEYFYRKNYTEEPDQKNDLETYADLYLNFKLKVQAAIDDGIELKESFINEYKEYRDMQAEEYLCDSAFLEETSQNRIEAVSCWLKPQLIVNLQFVGASCCSTISVKTMRWKTAATVTIV